MTHEVREPSPLAAAEKCTLAMRFEASPDTVAGILAVVQEWAAQKNIARDDGLSLRLVLEELLANISMHAAVPDTAGQVELRLELLPADGHGTRQASRRPTPPRALSVSSFETRATPSIP